MKIVANSLRSQAKSFMQIHELQKNTKDKKPKKVGRGGKRGKTSGRGHKGQKARAGRKIRPNLRDTIKKIPKLRGYRFNRAYDLGPEVVNLGDLEKNYKAGETVSPGSLLAKNLVKRQKGQKPRVKILGNGELKKKLKFKDVIFSKSAEAKIK